MSQSSNLTTFELPFSTVSSTVVECEFVEKSSSYDWFSMHRECRQTFKLFFFKFNLSHKLQLL